MEKIIIKDDIKGFEEEIDSAVDRLFVEGKNGPEKSVLIKSPILEPSYPSSSMPISFLKSVEKMEAQLLSLEWEVSKENLGKAKEEIFALRDIFKERPDIISVLNLMEKVLANLIEDQENIQPPQIKFLLDSMETIKLLMKKDQDEEFYVYKKLAYAGIEARFSCLEGLKNNKIIPSFLSLNGEIDRTKVFENGEKQVEKMLNKMNLLSSKIDGIFNEIDQQLSRLGQMTSKPFEQPNGTGLLPIDVTIFKVGGRLLGVESDKIFKLFKVPNSFKNKYLNPEKIRLKDIEVKMIDLKKIFSIQGNDQKEESQILTVVDNGGYKGWMIAQILKRLSFCPDIKEGLGESFSGLMHWTYQGHSVEVPILNLKKI